MTKTAQRDLPSEPITVAWLKQNGAKRGEGYWYFLNMETFLDVTVWFRGRSLPEVRLSPSHHAWEYRLGPFDSTARLIKLIEALTGEPWEGKS